MGRRFERDVDGVRRAWEVRLDGDALVFDTGIVGGRMRSRRQPFGDPEEAARKLGQALKEMEASGWTPVHVDVEIPDVLDDRALLVEADRLEESDDPRGELIALQAARGEEPATDAELRLIEQHWSEWLGALPEGTEVRWRMGYIDGLTLQAEGEGSEAAAALNGLVERGSVPALRTLNVVGSAHLGAVMHVLCGHGWPALQRVRLQGSELGRSLGEALDRWRDLRTLEVDVEALVPGQIQCPTLRFATFRMVNGPDIRPFAEAQWPELLQLSIDVRMPWRPERQNVQASIRRKLRRLSLGGYAASESLAGLETVLEGVDALVLHDVDNPSEVAWWLEQRQAQLPMPITLRGVEVSDAELSRLGCLTVDAGLPDVFVARGLDHRSPRQLSERRFERERNGKRRFWSLYRVNDEVHVRYGVVGHAGTSKVSTAANDVRAAADYRRRVRKKLAEGWVECSTRDDTD